MKEFGKVVPFETARSLIDCVLSKLNACFAKRQKENCSSHAYMHKETPKKSRLRQCGEAEAKQVCFWSGLNGFLLRFRRWTLRLIKRRFHPQKNIGAQRQLIFK